MKASLWDVIFWAIDITGLLIYQSVCSPFEFWSQRVEVCVVRFQKQSNSGKWSCVELAKVVKSFVRDSVRCKSDKPLLTNSDNNREVSIKAVAWRLLFILYSLHMKEGGFRKKIQSCCGIPTDQQIFGRVWFPKAFPTRTLCSFSQQSKKSANFMILSTDPLVNNPCHNHYPFSLW